MSFHFRKTLHFPSERYLAQCLFTGLAAGLYAHATACGPGLTADSHHYLAAARSLLHHGTLRHADGTAYTHWPPLYPVWLAALGGRLDTVKIGQGLVYAATVWALVRWVWQGIGVPVLRWTAATAIATGTPLLLVQVFVWSEGVFIFISALIFGVLRRYAATRRPADLAWLVFLSNLLCLQRLLGLAFVAGFAWLLWLSVRRRGPVAGYALGSGVAAGGWLWRNAGLENSSSAVENLFVAGPLAATGQCVQAVGRWFVPTGGGLAHAAGLAAAGVLCLWGLKTRRQQPSLPGQAALLALTYLACLCAAGGTPTETDRFVAPAYPWLLLGLGGAAAAVWPVLPAGRRGAASVLLVAWLAYPVGRAVKNSLFWHRGLCRPAVSMLHRGRCAGGPAPVSGPDAPGSPPTGS